MPIQRRESSQLQRPLVVIAVAEPLQELDDIRRRVDAADVVRYLVPEIATASARDNSATTAQVLRDKQHVAQVVRRVREGLEQPLLVGFGVRPARG